MIERTRTFTFPTTHHALWAEDVAQERGIPADVVPAPRSAQATCGMAIRTSEDRARELAEALDQEGIEYRSGQG